MPEAGLKVPELG